MAIAGGATTAYKLRMKDGKPAPERTTKASDRCDSPAAAVALLQTGGTPTVQGSDMTEFWRKWAEAQGAN